MRELTRKEGQGHTLTKPTSNQTSQSHGNPGQQPVDISQLSGVLITIFVSHDNG